MSYNGWTNYETWCVKLWIDNDHGTYLYWEEQTKAAVNAYHLADQLKDEVEEANPLADKADMFTDLLGAALSDVNWVEIAESMFEDWRSDEDETEEETEEESEE